MQAFVCAGVRIHPLPKRFRPGSDSHSMRRCYPRQIGNITIGYSCLQNGHRGRRDVYREYAHRNGLQIQFSSACLEPRVPPTRGCHCANRGHSSKTPSIGMNDCPRGYAVAKCTNGCITETSKVESTHTTHQGWRLGANEHFSHSTSY